MKERFFNTSGPIQTDIHYFLPPLERFDQDEVLRLIEARKYFVLHAPRQTGKTTCLLALRDELNRRGDYACVYANVEMAPAARENVADAIRAILGEIASRACATLGDAFLKENFVRIHEENPAHLALNALLTERTVHSAKPLVLLLDEVDALIGDTLISVLRQLWSGYDRRPADFPSSVILCVGRDVRD